MTYKGVSIDQIEMSLNQMEGCYLNDIIYIPLSPVQILEMAIHFKSEALGENKSYIGQGFYRQICNYFEDIIYEWRERREKRDSIHGHKPSDLSELLCCPFCGQQPKTYWDSTIGEERYREGYNIACCYAHVSAIYKEDAIAKWNLRPT